MNVITCVIILCKGFIQWKYMCVNSETSFLIYVQFFPIFLLLSMKFQFVTDYYQNIYITYL